MKNPKYPALNTIAGFYRILAWITIVITVTLMIVGVIATFVTGNYIGGGFFGFLGSLLGAALGSIVLVFVYGLVGFVAAVMQLAVAESLEVLMDIEENTRS
ncbi:MAG: hypothetical protein U9R53_10330 [Chloroflexota bacterium]|nr:hypothetical protein [Chloroflexota bacterium]